jgi:hypothetical protein
LSKTAFRPFRASVKETILILHPSCTLYGTSLD